MTTPELTDTLARRAQAAQQTLERAFWKPDTRLYAHHANPTPDTERGFHYWWFAHALDVLTDGHLRSRDPFYLNRARSLFEGMLERSGWLTNDYYDDMEWFALALLRLHQVSGDVTYLDAVHALWHDIKNGWNDTCGGGVAWRKTQLYYKNTPANAPAAILAARLYRLLGRPEDLDWAKRIYAWNHTHLVDPASGFVWDGLNREGNGRIDTDWEYTYCQGVVIGAALELHALTGDDTYRQEAVRTAHASRTLYREDGLLPDEGVGDGGLFKGIYVRYLAQLAQACPEEPFAAWLDHNAAALRGDGPFGTDWSDPQRPSSLSAHLSGTMLLEACTAIFAGRPLA